MSGIRKKEAILIAKTYLAERSKRLSDNDYYVLFEKKIIEKPYGWVFLYASKNYLDNPSFETMTFSNIPFLIQKKDGAIVNFGTAFSIETYINNYELKQGITIPPPVNYGGAVQKALEFLRAVSSHFSSEKLILLEEVTIEKPYGWVFFYESEKYLKTGNPEHKLEDNTPFLIKKKDGSAVVFGRDLPIEQYLKHYEQQHNLK